MKEETIEGLRELFGENINILFEKYLEDSQNLVNLLGQAIINNDLDGVSKTAHPLKSSSRQMGAETLADFAAELEHKGKNNDNSNIKSIYQDLTNEYIQVCEYVNQLMNE